MKILSPGITQYFTNEIDRVLDLVVGIRLPLFEDDYRTNHVALANM
jgi:hypothetical protein